MANISKAQARLKKHKKNRKNIFGTATKPRLSVYKSNMQISAQLINDETGVTIASSSSIGLKLKGVNIEIAKKVGEDIAKKALALKIKNVVFDRGGFLYHGKVQALADSARVKGLNF